MLHNTIGGGKVAEFPEKSVTKMYGSRYEGVGGHRLIQGPVPWTGKMHCWTGLPVQQCILDW